MSGLEAVCALTGIVVTQICTVVGLWIQARGNHVASTEKLDDLASRFDTHLRDLHPRLEAIPAQRVTVSGCHGVSGEVSPTVS